MPFIRVTGSRSRPRVSAARLVALASDLQFQASIVSDPRLSGFEPGPRPREGGVDCEVASGFGTDDVLMGYFDRAAHHDIAARHIAGVSEKDLSGLSVPQSDDTTVLTVGTIGGTR